MNENAYQAMPRKGKLAQNLNLSREALPEKFAPFQHDTVYSYIVDTVEYEEGRLRQCGSGPNFQGGLITLCSCKHWMRTARHTESWKGVWVAGFTRKSLGNRLFYLMRVSEAFESHSKLWFSDLIPEETKDAKVADLGKFGDIYRPKVGSGNPYCHQSYLPPCKSHVHRRSNLWHKDIKHTLGYGKRPSALLVGDPEYSFLWDKPIAASPFKLSQGQKKTKLSELFPFS